jgi:acetyl-CoA C-acetyltransferase
MAERTGITIGRIDLFEVNEAVAPVARLKTPGADPNKLNVHGDAIALGHPFGGPGAMRMSTLIHALHRRNKRCGLPTICEGGGIAHVTIREALH